MVLVRAREEIISIIEEAEFLLTTYYNDLIEIEQRTKYDNESLEDTRQLHANLAKELTDNIYHYIAQLNDKKEMMLTADLLIEEHLNSVNDSIWDYAKKDLLNVEEVFSLKNILNTFKEALSQTNLAEFGDISLDDFKNQLNMIQNSNENFNCEDLQFYCNKIEEYLTVLIESISQDILAIKSSLSEDISKLQDQISWFNQ